MGTNLERTLERTLDLAVDEVGLDRVLEILRDICIAHGAKEPSRALPNGLPTYWRYRAAMIGNAIMSKPFRHQAAPWPSPLFDIDDFTKEMP